jgi:hypothetical protein
VLSQRVPFEREHENGRTAFRKIDTTARWCADRRESSLSARTAFELPTIRAYFAVMIPFAASRNPPTR